MVRFRILGPLEVRTDEDWSGIGAQKWRALLATLLLNPGQLVSTDRLITEIWADDPPAKATNLVSIYVLRLRRLMGDSEGRVLITRAPGYQLRVEPGELDADQFETLVAEGRDAMTGSAPERAAASLAEALALWRGRALADVSPSPLVTAEAARLEELRIAAVEMRIEADLACGRHAQVAPELGRLIADHPLREGFWALLMRALDGAGRHAEALGAYERARAAIADELGVDPGTELQQLFQQLLTAGVRPTTRRTPVRSSGDVSVGGISQGEATAARAPAEPNATPERPLGKAADPGSSSTVSGVSDTDSRAVPTAPLSVSQVPQQLPADIADFTGRSEHVKHLGDLLSEAARDDDPGAVVVVLVAGAGGLGKTALAVHAAHRLRARFPDGQLYVNLLGAGPEPAASGDVLARFLRDMGVHGTQIPDSEEERAALYRTRLTGRRTLIVLDNARDAAQVRPLLPGSASSAVLVTSRNRLSDLAWSQLVDLDVLDDDEARALFVRVVGPARAEAELNATEEVLTACAGLPLAIRIAGARLAARSGWTVRTLANRLSDEHRRLDELKVGDLAIRACFQVSFASLPAHSGPGGLDPAQAFRLLGLWHGPSVGLPAASALFGEPEERVADVLELLVDAHLLESPLPDRYRLHDLLRVYAAERALAEEPDQARADAIRRILTWYVHTAEVAALEISPHRTRIRLQPAADFRPLSFTSLDQAFDWYEHERANLVAATRQAEQAGMDEIAWQLPAAALSFFTRRRYWADCITTHDIALASVRRVGNRWAEALVLNNLGMALSSQRMDAALGYFDQALAIRREIGDLRGVGQSVSNMADYLVLRQRFGEALDPLQEALAIQRQVANRYGEGIALNNLGEAYVGLGRFEDAIGCLQQARDIFREIGEGRGEGYTLRNLGEAYVGLGRADEALDCLRQALAIHHAVGEGRSEAATLKHLGRAQRYTGQLAAARESWTRAHAIFDELGDETEAAEVYSELVALSTESDRDL